MSEQTKVKKIYIKPTIETDEMLLFGGGGGGGATCDGSSNGGKKGTDVAPDNCSASKLKT